MQLWPPGAVFIGRLKQDRETCKSADEIRRWGFSTQQWQAASILQASRSRVRTRVHAHMGVVL